MGENELPLLEKEDDMVYGAYEDLDGETQLWWKGPIKRTYDPKKHAHDGELLTRSVYNHGPELKRVFPNDGLSTTGIRAYHGDQIGTKEGLHIHVHGFNTDQQSATAEFDKIASHFDNEGTVDHVGFNWDSFGAEEHPPHWNLWTQDLLGPGAAFAEYAAEYGAGKFSYAWDASVAWPRARSIARRNGKRLATVVIDQLTGSENDINIFLSGYSLGSQVVLEAVRHLDEYYDYEEFKSNGGILAGVYLVGAAVPAAAVSTDNSQTWKYTDFVYDPAEPKGSVNKKGEAIDKGRDVKPYGKAIERVLKDKPAGNCFVTTNMKDQTLGITFPVGDGHWALGWDGPLSGVKNAANLEVKAYDHEIPWSEISFWELAKDFHGKWPEVKEPWKDIEKKMKQSNELSASSRGDKSAELSIVAEIDVFKHPPEHDTESHIRFDGSDSTADDETSVDHHWDFEDPSISTRSSARFMVPLDEFSQSGEHTVTLTATDAAGRTKSRTFSFSVPDTS